MQSYAKYLYLYQRTTLKGCLKSSNSPLLTLHTSLKGLRLRGRALILCSFTRPTPNLPSTRQLLLTTNQPHSHLLFTAASSTAITAAQGHWCQTKGRDSSWRAVQESLLPFITALKCVRVLQATIAPSHVPLTDIKGISRNTMIQKQGMKTQEAMVWVAILLNPD